MVSSTGIWTASFHSIAAPVAPLAHDCGELTVAYSERVARDRGQSHDHQAIQEKHTIPIGESPCGKMGLFPNADYFTYTWNITYFSGF
jgi:hypothetical protein